MAQLNILVGHRGVGKSSLLHRIESYFAEAKRAIKILDLDDLIAQGEGKSLKAIWDEFGESYFRKLERDYFKKTITALQNSENNDPVFLAVGAGFEDPGLCDFDTLWVRRVTDPQGRIFLNRPRLNSNCDPLTEYQERFQYRNSYYKKICKRVLTLPEGFDQPYQEEKNWFLNKIEHLKGSMLYNPKFADPAWIKTRIQWGVSYFELRDDLLTPEQIREALARIPPENILLSLRSPQATFRNQFISSPLAKNLFWDWALEIGPPEGTPSIISYHGGGPQASQEILADIESKFPRSIIKWAPLTDQWQDLIAGHKWFLERPQSRVFLPRSTAGRWVWYRLFLRDKARLNFFREDEGASDDQPLLLEWSMMTRFPEPINQFAAVLGDPVVHSRTCVEHRDFFNQRNQPVFRISLSRNEWNSEVFSFLDFLGLKYAAITSPLKELLFQSTPKLSERARHYKSVNTLVKQESGQWLGDFTDLDGLAVLLKDVPDNASTVVWGGGGLLAALKTLLPQAHYYSAQTGDQRISAPEVENSNSQHIKQDNFEVVPRVVIWAAGNYNQVMPPSDWRPDEVIDLSYSDDSRGRLYAVNVGSTYKSGMVLFKEQARKQREFWGRNEC